MVTTTARRRSAPLDRPPLEAGQGRWFLAIGGLGGFLAALFVGVITTAWATTGMDDATAGGRSGSGGVTLLEGERIYASQCAQCHGTVGEGGVGARLGGGAVVEKYPDLAAQMSVISNGRGAMPPFENSLTPEQIEAVARYEREQLGR